MAVSNAAATLRGALRAATREAHDSLDLASRTFGWATREGYARFLSFQHAARSPIEKWLGEQDAPAAELPGQSKLIARDCAALGLTPSPAPLRFDLPETASLTGLSWAIAGSSLGNRSIARDIVKAGHDHWPRTFLEDPAMPAYWQALRPRLERPASAGEVAAATQGALAVFAHFSATLEHLRLKAAA